MASIAAIYFLYKWAKVLICVSLALLAIYDLHREKPDMSIFKAPLNKIIGVIVLSFCIFLIDENHIWCDPMSLWQWHGVWHLGASGGIYLYSLWRFNLLGTDSSFMVP